MAHLSFILLTIPRGVFVLLTVGSVFLKIIKIIFLVILALIGLILLLLIIVLAAPVRYQVRGGWTGELLLKGKVTWLYRILGVRVQLVEKKPEIKISIFGYTLGSKKKCCKKRKKKKDSDSDADADVAQNPVETGLEDDLFEEQQDQAAIGDAGTGSMGDAQTESSLDSDSVITESSVESVQTDASAQDGAASVGDGLQSSEEVETAPEDDVVFSETDTPEDWEENGLSPEDELLFEEALDLAEETAAKKQSLVSRIKVFLHQIKARIASLFKRVKDALPFGKKKAEAPGTELAEQEDIPEEIDLDAVEKDGALTRIKGMITRGQEFLAVPSVKKLIGKMWKSIRKILRHLMPTDLQVDARVGMGDPAKTGQIMELGAILYAFYGDHIRIESSFDREVKEGQAELTGRIIPGYLLLKAAGMGLRIILNKECRRLYKEIRS